MSTHSALGVEMEDGSIIGCYVHFDGHTMKGRIESFLKQHTTTDLAVMITRAQSSGGIRSFYSPDDYGTPVTDFLDDSDPYVITAQNWKEDHMFTEARYLVNYTDKTIKISA